MAQNAPLTKPLLIITTIFNQRAYATKLKIYSPLVPTTTFMRVAPYTLQVESILLCCYLSKSSYYFMRAFRPAFCLSQN